MSTTTNQTRTIISQREFDKKVDIEAAHLEYMDRLKPTEAREKAISEIAKRFATQ